MSYNYNDPKIWGPYYWFVFHTITLNYPLNPNIVCKKNTTILFKQFLYYYQTKILVIILLIYLINTLLHHI